MTPRDFWTARCRDARKAVRGFDTERALCLVIEGFVAALAVAESDGRWLPEIHDFAAEIQRIFEPWEIAEYLHRSRLAIKDRRKAENLDWANEILLQDSGLLGWPMETRPTNSRTGVR